MKVASRICNRKTYVDVPDNLELIAPAPVPVKPVFPILGVFRLKGQPRRDGSSMVRSCKASQSSV